MPVVSLLQLNGDRRVFAGGGSSTPEAEGTSGGAVVFVEFIPVGPLSALLASSGSDADITTGEVSAILLNSASDADVN
jgi:hypothetical protein